MRSLTVIAACALGAGLCAAQTVHTTQTVGWQKTADTMFFTMELGAGKVVKGAPYSAQSISEFEQQLADGNRIVRSNSGMVYRDSEGRTRREQPMGGMGLLGPAAPLPSMVIITDPVAGFTYTLNPQDKTATKTPLPPEHAGAGAGGGVLGGIVMAHPTGAATSGGVAGGLVQSGAVNRRVQSDNAKTESLGIKSFDAVVAEGTRTVMTIPAGQMGNERPIESLTERWFSQQLQVTVFSQVSDPRMGKTTERLSGINLAEPPHSLFEIPADYTVREGASNWITIKPAQVQPVQK